VDRRRFHLTITCFVILLILGLGFTLYGIFIIPMLPTVLLDVVIAPQDIADVPKRKEALSILTTAWGGVRFVWVCAGLLVVATSSLGLWATSMPDRSNAAD
jgi:hypothetical protein